MPSHGGYVKEVIMIRKQADEPLASDNTLNDDAELFVPVAANEQVFVEIFAHYEAGAGGVRASVNGPALFTHLHYVVEIISSAGLNTSAAETAWDQIAARAGALAGIIRISLGLHNGVNAGNIVFRWAQNASNGANTIVHQDSFIRLTRVTS